MKPRSQSARWTVLSLALALGAALSLPAAGAAGDQPPGTVTVSYDLGRLPLIASNQVAVWIEDSQGRFVKTLYVSWFTGKGGYDRRPECLPLWRRAAGLEGPPTPEVDAVTRATQQPGKHSLAWDGTDRAGKAVAAGKYVYKVEGTVFWTKEVLWTGEITVGAVADSSRASVRYLPEGSQSDEQMVTSVAAVFTPAGSLSR